MMRRRARPAIVLGVASATLLVACQPAASPTPTGSAATALASPSIQASAEASVAPEAGRPYDAEDILAAMRDSRRPGGVPDEIQTETIAAAIAAEVWTWSAEPWETIAASGGCGPATCTLELAGAPPDAAGVDLYTFEIDPAGESVSLSASDLHGYPAALEPQLDAAAREDVPAAELEGLALAAAAWLPPPDSGRFRLAYRSGGEEGAPGLDVVLELGSGEVLSVEPVD